MEEARFHRPHGQPSEVMRCDLEKGDLGITFHLSRSPESMLNQAHILYIFIFMSIQLKVQHNSLLQFLSNNLTSMNSSSIIPTHNPTTCVKGIGSTFLQSQPKSFSSCKLDNVMVRQKNVYEL